MKWAVTTQKWNFEWNEAHMADCKPEEVEDPP